MALNIQSVFTIVAGVQGQQNVDRFVKSLDQGRSAGDRFKTTVLGMKGTLAALGVGLSAAAMVAWGRSAVNAADQAEDMAQSLGLNVTKFMELSAAAKTAGVDAGTLTGILAKLNQKLFDAATGNEDAQAQLQAVGIGLKEVKDGSITADQALQRILKSVSSLPDGFQKTAIMMELMGKGGYKLLPLADSMEKFKSLASEDAVHAAAKLADMFDALGEVMTWLTVEVISGLTSAIGDVLDGFMELVNNEDRYIGFWDLMGATVKGFFTIVGEALRFISIGVMTVMKAVDAVVVSINAAGRVIEAVISGNFKSISGIWDKYKEEMGSVAETWADTTMKMSASSPLVGGSKISRADKSGAKPDISGFGDDAKRLREAIKDTEKKIALINAEAQAIGISNYQKELSNNLQEMENKGIKRGTAEWERLSAAMQQAVLAKTRATENKELEEFVRKEQDAIKAIDDEISLIGKSQLEIKQATEARRIDNEVREKSKDLTEIGAEALRIEAEALKKNTAAALARADAANRTWGAGAKKAMQEYVDNATNAAKQAERVFNTAVSGMEDALTEFVMTGKLNFRQFANDIIKEIVRIQIQKSIAGMIGGAGGSGGFGSWFASLFHSGGIVGEGGGQGRVVPAGLFAGAKRLHGGGFIGTGEVPAILKQGEGVFTPEQMKAMGGGGVNVNINVYADSGKESTQGDDGNGMAELGRRIAAVAKQVIIDEKRPGGLLAA